MKNKIEKFVGKKGYIVIIGGMMVDVKIKDVKNSYGRTRYLVTPVQGSGEAWVENITL